MQTSCHQTVQRARRNACNGAPNGPFYPCNENFQEVYNRTMLTTIVILSILTVTLRRVLPAPEPRDADRRGNKPAAGA